VVKPISVELRLRRPRAGALIGALALGLLAAATPVDALAALLAEDSRVEHAKLIGGVWMWKLATLLLALICLAADQLRPAARDAAPLLERGESGEEPPSVRQRALALGACFVGLGLRLFDLGAGLWFDEIDTLLRYGSASALAAISSFETQNNHLAYSLLANRSIAIFGADAWALRLPAALLGAASLWATWKFALRVAPRTQALIATWLMAVSYHHVWFSQNARGYTGLLLATLVSSAAFLAMLWQRKPQGLRLPLVYGLAASFGVWMHTTAVFVVVAHGLIWLVLGARARETGSNRWPPLWGFVFATALSIWGYALVLPQFLDTLAVPSMVGHETPWRNPLWMLRETLAGLAAGLPGGWLALVEGGLVLALGLWSFWRQSRALLAVLLLPAAITAAVLLAQGHNLWPRFFFFSAGFALLIVVRGIFTFVELMARGPLASLRGWLALAAASLLVLASAATLPRVYGPKQDFAAAAEYVRRRAPAGAVATLEMGKLPFLDYLRQPWAQIGSLQELMDFERDHPEAWVVLATPAYLAAVQPQTWARLQTEYAEEKVFAGSARGGEIVVKVRREPSRDH